MPTLKFAMNQQSVMELESIRAEAVGGGASVLLQKAPSAQEVYNDLDREIFHVFRTLRDCDQTARLAEPLALSPLCREVYPTGAWTGLPPERKRPDCAPSFCGCRPG